MAKHKKTSKKSSKKKHSRRRSSSGDSSGSSDSWEEVPKTKTTKKGRKKRERSSSEHSGTSDSSGSVSECSWEDRGGATSGRVGGDSEKIDSKASSSKEVEKTAERATREDWLGDSDLFSSMTKNYRDEKREKVAERKQQQRNVNIVQPGQHTRELNPYWKDGGRGLPEDDVQRTAGSAASSSTATTSTSRSLPSTASSHGQLEWLQRAFRRLKEEAHDKQLLLEEVARERWGSLAKLENLIREAKANAGLTRPNQRHNNNTDKRLPADAYCDPRGSGSVHRKHEDRRRRMLRPNSDEDEADFHGKSSRHFARPRHDSDSGSGGDGGKRREAPRHSSSTSREQVSRYRKDTSERRSWKKNEPQSKRSPRLCERNRSQGDEVMEEETAAARESGDRRRLESERPRQSKNDEEAGASTSEHEKRGAPPESASSRPMEPEPKVKELTDKLLSDTELNKLAAKLLKAEMMGNTEQASKLRQKIEDARKLRAESQLADDKASGQQAHTQREEVVVLTKTDSRGVSRPVQPVREEDEASRTQKRKKIKADTHSGGERTRYFADDDRQSLNEMFEREKLSTAADDVAMFAKMAGRIKVKPGDDDYTVDDAFVDRAARQDNSRGQRQRDTQKAIHEHRSMQRTLDSCRLCIESPSCLKHLLISVGHHVALSLPSFQSLTEGHCILAPTQHVVALTLADEDVWQEIMRFRRALTDMFASADQDCVFLETATGLTSSRQPHAALHCIPVPREVGELLPMYYKKAILESETEWAQNKKLVDLSKKRGLRNSIPKGLPYFAVDFGTDHGFAHVIEDEREFPRHFGLEIVGGLLDCEPRLWLKQQNEDFKAQSRKAVIFGKMWSSYEFNKELIV